MDVNAIVQEILDRVLLPFGVVSHDTRHVKVDKIDGSDVKVNNDGAQILFRAYVDVNYYYTYEKTDGRVAGVKSRLQAVKREILRDEHFRIANDITDTPDVDNPYRGLNVEFAYIGSVGNG